MPNFLSPKPPFALLVLSLLWAFHILPVTCLADLYESFLVSEVKIEIQGSHQERTELENMAVNFIRLKKGDLFVHELLEESIKALKRSDRFREVRVEVEESDGEIALLFTLVPFRLIKDIRIKGAFPILEREILNTMALYVSDAFLEDAIPGQIQLMSELLRREGYNEPKIEIRPVKDPADGNYVLFVDISKGTYFFLEELTFRGNSEYPDTALKRKMKSWRVTNRVGAARRFIEEDFMRDLQNLTTFYRKKGFLDVILEYSIERYPEKKSVKALVEVFEGPLYRVEIEGNRKFPYRTLRNDLVVFKEGNRFGLGSRRSAKKMEKRYQGKGFTGASVSFHTEKISNEPEAVRLVTFSVTEGSRSTVQSLQISGNSMLSGRQILKQMQTHPRSAFRSGSFVPERLEDDIIAIRALYTSNGFYNVAIDPEVTTSDDKRHVFIIIHILEGKKVIVSSVRIEGLNGLGGIDAYGILSVRKGETLKRHLVRRDEIALANLISGKGFPYVQVKGDVFYLEDGSACDVVYTVSEGPQIRMGEVYFRGNFRTKENILRRELELKRDDPFSLSKVLETQQNMRNMLIFESVTFTSIGLAEKWDRAHLLVDVVEKKPFFLEIGGGYDTGQGFFLNTKAGDHNLFGKNKYGWIGADISQTGYRAEIGLTEPRLFGSHVAANFSTYGEQRMEFNQPFGTKTLGAALGFKWSRPRHLSAGIGLRYERREQFPTVPGTDLTFITDPRSILVATPILTYDTRNSFLYPNRGILSVASIDISKGIEYSIDDFLKLQLEQRAYATLIHPLTFALTGRFGYIIPYGPLSQVPADQLFYLGGTADVRGFRENMLFFNPDGTPAGGTVAISGSIESRIDLGHNFELSLFYDTGLLGEDIPGIFQKPFRSSTGFGLRYKTPVGPIGLLYGINLSPMPDESRGRLHFSIGYTF